MLSGILNSRVLCRSFDATREFYLRRAFGVATEFCSRFGREVKFYCAEFRSEAPKSRFYKILKSYFYALKFYARRSFKFLRRSCGLYSAIPNTHHLKFYDRAAEFLRDGALKFYRYAEFKRLQYFKASPSSYARSGFCK